MFEYMQDGELWFHPETNESVRCALLTAYRNRTRGRIRIWYGDVASGKSWLEEYDVLGTVGRSMGQFKVPLLIANSRSSGGGAILDHRIVRVNWVNGNTLFKHPQFSHGTEGAKIRNYNGKSAVVLSTGEVHATFSTSVKAERWLSFMRGERYSK